MKRSLIILTGCALALTACTSEDVINEGALSNVIGFENAVKKQSRAGDTAIEGTDLTVANLDKFLVYGYYSKENQSGQLIQVFGGEVVSKNGNTWEYKNTRYWVPGATYNFFAYSCADVALANDKGTPEMFLSATDPNNRELKISSYICDRNHQHDLIYARALNIVGKDKATTEGSAPANAPVSFNFQHVLSKINAKFVSDFPSDYTIAITNVEIVNFRNKGNYSGSAGWKDVERQKENESTPIYIFMPFAGDNIVQNGGDNEAYTKSVYMIPYTYQTADVQLTFTIEVKKDGETIISRPMTGSWRPNWEAGKAYTYTIRLTGSDAQFEPIVFETSKDMNLEWASGTDNTSTDITFSAN